MARARCLAPLAAVLAGLLLAGCASPRAPVGDNRCHPRAGAAQCVTAPPRALSLLADDQPVTVRVDARCEWNPTGIILQRGASYRVAVTRVLEEFTRTPRLLSAGGRYAQRWARAEGLPLGTLVAAQGREQRTFLAVAPETRFTAARGEELLFFANDWPGSYDDNRGCVELEVRKLSQ